MVCEHEQLMLATTAELFIPFFYTDAMFLGISLNQTLLTGAGVCVMKKHIYMFLSKDSLSNPNHSFTPAHYGGYWLAAYFVLQPEHCESLFQNSSGDLSLEGCSASGCLWIFTDL